MANELALVDSTVPLRPVNPIEIETIGNIPSTVALTVGDAVYQIPSSTGAGFLAKADASALATAKALGITIKSAAARQAVTILRKGIVDGFNLGDLAYGDPIYLSDTAGALSTVPGTIRVPVGFVLSNPTGLVGQAPDKVLYLDFTRVFLDPAVDEDFGNTIDLAAEDQDTDDFVTKLQTALVALGVIAAS